MEDWRDQFILIVAGYREPMQDFLESNPGLRSRFARTITFPDYSPAELAEILKAMVNQAHYILTPSAEAIALARFTALHGTVQNTFANTRSVRIFFERMLQNQSNRLAADPHLSREDLVTLQDGDVPELGSLG